MHPFPNPQCAIPDRDPFFPNVVLLLHGDGANNSTTIVDSSASAKTMTVGGVAKLTTAQKKYGNASIAFTGAAADVVQVTGSTDFAFGTGDFTIEAWVYLNSITGGFQTIFTTRSGAGANASWFGADTAGKLAYYEVSAIALDSVALPLNTWTHVAVTRQGTALKLWKNGVSVATATNSTNLNNTTGSAGNDLFGGGNPFPLNGDLDEIRVTKAVARYTAAFTPPTGPFPNSN